MSGIAAVKQNVKKIVGLEFNSSVLRKLLGLYYRENKKYSVLFGPMKGMKVVYNKDINFHTVMGLYEKENFDVLGKLIHAMNWKDQPFVFFDAGSNIGMYAMFFAKLLESNSELQIHCFEPGEIAAVLKQNLALNQMGHTHVWEVACADTSGPVEFFLGHNCKSSLDKSWASGKGQIEVKAIQIPGIALDDWVEEKKIPVPSLIKFDIEGGAAFALKGCYEIIQKHRPFFIVESHNSAEDIAIGEVIRSFDYAGFRTDNYQWVKYADRDYKDPDGVWGTILLCPNEHVERLKSVFA